MSSDRSTLESKDRAELTVIAEAMGAKVASRMRKGQIIDLIIGANNGGEEPQQPEASGPAKERRASGKRDADDRRDTANSRDTANNGADDQGEAANGGAADPGEAEATDGKRSNKGGSDSQSHEGTGSEPADRGDAESGNKRRRRRRGRDREELPWEGEPISVEGFLDLRSDGYGFLRVNGGIPSRDDCYVPVKMVRDFGLRSGDSIRGTSRPAARNEKNPALLSVDAVNERDPEEARGRPNFDELTPIFPDEQLVLERASSPANLTSRIIDLVAPIGKGQRGLIVPRPRRARRRSSKRSCGRSRQTIPKFV